MALGTSVHNRNTPKTIPSTLKRENRRYDGHHRIAEHLLPGGGVEDTPHAREARPACRQSTPAHPVRYFHYRPLDLPCGWPDDVTRPRRRVKDLPHGEPGACRYPIPVASCLWPLRYSMEFGTVLFDADLPLLKVHVCARTCYGNALGPALPVGWRVIQQTRGVRNPTEGGVRPNGGQPRGWMSMV